MSILLFREEGPDRDIRCPSCRAGLMVDWCQDGYEVAGDYRHACPECGEEMIIKVRATYSVSVGEGGEV